MQKRWIMFFKFSVLILTAVLMLGITANVTFGAPTTIRFWHVWDGARVKLIDNQVADFEKLHPGIKVEHSLIDQKALHQKYLTAIAAGDPPEVIMLRGGDMPSYASKKAIIPLNGYLERDKLNVDLIFYPAEIATHKYGNKTYSLPVVAGGALYMLFYNKEIFSEAGLDPERPPKTWQELMDYSKKLTIKKGSQVERLGFNPTAGGSFPPGSPFMVWLYTNNGRLLDTDGKKALFGSKEGLETLEWLQEFIKQTVGKFDSVRTLAGGDKNTNRLAFYNKKQVMINEGNYHFYQMSKEAPEIKYGVGELPYNSKNPKASSLTPTEGGWGYAITQGCKNKEAAWEFLKYATMEEGAKKFVRAQGRPSPVREFNMDQELIKANPYWPVVISALENSRPVATTTVQPKIKEVINTMEERVFYEKVTPKEAIKSAEKDVEKLLKTAK